MHRWGQMETLWFLFIIFKKCFFFSIFSSSTAFLNDLWSCYILHETTLFCVSLCHFVLAHDSAFVIFHLAVCLTFDCHKCFAIIESLIGWVICTKEIRCYSQEKDVFTLCNKTSYLAAIFIFIFLSINYEITHDVGQYSYWKSWDI